MPDDGLGALATRLSAIADQAHRELAGGLLDAAEYILEQSSREVPLEEGTLLRSGTTAVDAAGLVAAVGYGRGGAAAYAVVQHERDDYRHNGGRKAHYLSDPTARSAEAVGRIIGQPVRAVFGG